MPASHILIIGGQRSGKSRFATALAGESGLRKVMIATAEAGDDEMAERIGRHRAERDASWTTVEAPLDLANAIGSHSASDVVVVVDCLTLWLANLMAANADPGAASRGLATALAAARGPVILVTNEVGAGIIPDNPLARRFADALGFLNQATAKTAERVVLMNAGIATLIKPSSQSPIRL